MATNSKNIDPRFDPTFQRGYARGEQGEQVDAVRAARTVDAFRDDAARSQSAPPQPQQTSPNPATSPEPAPIAEPPEQPSVSPQSHYVDGAGALAEIVPLDSGKSLARNPWIYVLWIVGAVASLAGGVGQLALYGPLYGETWGSTSLFSLLPMIQSLGPAIANLGTLCLVAALLVHALNWMRKNQ